MKVKTILNEMSMEEIRVAANKIRSIFSDMGIIFDIMNDHTVDRLQDKHAYNRRTFSNYSGREADLPAPILVEIFELVRQKYGNMLESVIKELQGSKNKKKEMVIYDGTTRTFIPFVIHADHNPPLIRTKTVLKTNPQNFKSRGGGGDKMLRIATRRRGPINRG